MFGGFTSCIVAGRISDKYERINYKTKSYVSAAMCFIAVPLCLCLFLYHKSFYISVTLLFIYQLLCVGYLSPVIAMIWTVVDVKNKGAAIGAF